MKSERRSRAVAISVGICCSAISVAGTGESSPPFTLHEVRSGSAPKPTGTRLGRKTSGMKAP